MSAGLRKKLFTLAALTLGGGTSFCAICIYKANSKFYESYMMPCIRRLDPERAHNLAIKMLKYKLISSSYQDPPSLETTFLGTKLSNPLGIAAGFDKQGEAVLGLEKTGFGFSEIGTVTPLPQSGNSKPRVFRLQDDGAIINRYGFNSDGQDVVHARIAKCKSKMKGRLGVNLGKNKDSENAARDYAEGIKKFSDVADYLVINISSPNTPGLRELQKGGALVELLDAVIKVRNKLKIKKPLFIKLSPDLTAKQQQQIADEIMKRKDNIEGLIISNTTITRPPHLKSIECNEVGGLSGEPLKDTSTQLIRRMYALTNGEFTIIGVGGISTGWDAYEKIRAGASLVQIYTALAFTGPPVTAIIKQQLAACLQKDGFQSVEEAVGVDVSK